MAKKFRGRLEPNIQRNPDKPLRIRFIKPRRADGVTILIKELDTYRAAVRSKGRRRQISEGSQDDLLATFTGRIRKRRFQVDTHNNENDSKSLPIIKIKFQGSDDIYEIPVGSQEGEVEGTNWEIAFTVQYPGQEDYNSPVAFIPRVHGNALIVDNPDCDKKWAYEAHANLIHHFFTSRGIVAKIIRGTKSRKTVAHYSEEDTTDYIDGYDYRKFTRIANNFNYMYINAHGNIDLTGDGEWEDPCVICKLRFHGHHSFGDCKFEKKCGNRGNGFFLYKGRTDKDKNAIIRLKGKKAEVDLRNAVDLWEIVNDRVDYKEYKNMFLVANLGDPDVKVKADICEIKVPNTYKYPTLPAFPAHDYRKNFLPHIPPSSYLHHKKADDVPGVAAIIFAGEGTPLSAEVSATPSGEAGPPPEFPPLPPLVLGLESTPPPVQASAFNKHIWLTWDEVSGAHTYTLYRSTKPGVNEHNSRVIKNIKGTSYLDKKLSNGQTYYYKIRGRKWGGNLSLKVLEKGSINLSNVKVMYAGACNTGMKIDFADAVLDKGVIFFIAHQVGAGETCEKLANKFWRRWLQGGAILRNLIRVYNSVVLQSPKAFTRTRPVIYYRDTSTQTKFWRPFLETLPDPDNIKLD
ncbi:MAG: hypothetical protein ACFFCW_18365 [Candidatus Hodarchaeota archaeon]